VLLPEFTLERPRSLAEAAALASRKGARLIAGGTGLVPNLRLGLEVPKVLVALDAIPELREIRLSQLSENHIRIGAAVTLQQLCDADGIPTAVKEAARAVGAPTHRSAATLGGNLCLDTRCLYYNQSEQWRRSNGYCLKHGGDTCHVAPRGKQCRAAFSGDLAPALLALEAQVEIFGAHGRHTLLLENLYREDGARPLTLEPGEVVAAVHVPARPLRSGYAKARRRGAIDFPLAGVAIALELRDGRVAHLSAALTGTNSRPILLSDLGSLVGREPGSGLEAALGKRVEKEVKPLRTGIGAADYRRQVAVVLARRLLARLTAAETQEKPQENRHEVR
jgi:4-hydroxybenzoyl-CoA reductase subunit beta